MLVSCLLAGLTACSGDDMSDLKDYVRDVKARRKGAIEPLPEVRVVEPFLFRANQARDPFEPDAVLQEPTVAQAESGVRPDTRRPREVLESFELDTLRMVGTVRQEGMVWALLNAKDGTIHRVRIGNYLGRNFGKIVKILDKQIELVEIYADSSGVWRERKAALSMTDTAEKEQ
ncbi:MAG: pilus assembly protein PilP [Methylococcaceae bacterium]|nr:pilus assembly protein PilP [Methylococcaceae bacterium]